MLLERANVARDSINDAGGNLDIAALEDRGGDTEDDAIGGEGGSEGSEEGGGEGEAQGDQDENNKEGGGDNGGSTSSSSDSDIQEVSKDVSREKDRQSLAPPTTKSHAPRTKTRATPVPRQRRQANTAPESRTNSPAPVQAANKTVPRKRKNQAYHEMSQIIEVFEEHKDQRWDKKQQTVRTRDEINRELELKKMEERKEIRAGAAAEKAAERAERAEERKFQLQLRNTGLSQGQHGVEPHCQHLGTVQTPQSSHAGSSLYGDSGVLPAARPASRGF